jgi:site-specific DNA recombinase
VRTKSKANPVEASPRTIAVYCRVSTDEQAREGISLDEQKARLLSYCHAMGWKTEPVVYVDDGYSAKNTDRPALKKLIHSVESGHIAKVMVTKLDRMSRRLLDLLTLIDLFQAHNVTFISTSEAFDTATPSGRLTLQVLGAVAEFERERIRERVLDNMFHAAKSGKWLTQAPYGYRLEDKVLVIQEPEAEIVRSIFQMYVHQGLGYYAIAKRLNEQGIASKQNKQWSLRSVKLLLMNPAYKGTFIWNRVDTAGGKREERDKEDWIVVPDCLPVIVEPSLWEETQRKVNRYNLPPRAQSSPHLLGGLLKCGHCGSPMSIGWSGWPKRNRIYRCSANKNKGTCSGKSYRADDVEYWFKSGLVEISKRVTAGYSANIIEITKTGKRDNTKQQMGQAHVRYERKVAAYTAGLISLSDLTKAKAILEHELRLLAAVNQPAEINLQQLEHECKTAISDIAAALDALPISEAKALIRTFVSQVIVIGEGELNIAFT